MAQRSFTAGKKSISESRKHLVWPRVAELDLAFRSGRSKMENAEIVLSTASTRQTKDMNAANITDFRLPRRQKLCRPWQDLLVSHTPPWATEKKEIGINTVSTSCYHVSMMKVKP